MSDFDSCQADNDSNGENNESELEDLWVCEELSQSEDEISGNGPKR